MADYEVNIGVSVETSELDSTEKRINDLVNNKHTIKIDTSNSTKKIDDITDSVKNAQKSTSSFGDVFKRALGIGTTATLAMKSIRLIGKAAKEAFDNVKVLDKSMTELRKVTDETPQTYNKILSDASSTAKEIGTSIHGLIDSTADFARLGYSIGDSQQLAKVANIYAVVGDEVNGVDAATKSIISTMAAFKISANDSIKIVDKFNEVGNNYAISSGGIGVALERSASSMAAAGNTLDESIALIAAANSVVQNPESVGTAFKTITMRIRGAKTELEDAGLSTDGMATSVSKLRDEIRALSGVDIMQNDSTFKSTYQIMDDLSRKWKELSDIQKASITELIAGKRQGNIVSSLLENFDIARNALNSSLNSDGSAMAEHEKWLDSIEAKTNQLKAAFESLSVNTLSSALVGDIVQATTALVTFLDKTNVVKTSLAGLAAAGAIKTFTTLATGIANAAMQMDRLNSALDIVKAGNIGQSQLEQIIALTNNLSTSQLGAVMSAKALNNEQRKAILMARGLSEAEAESTLSTMGQGGSSIIKFFAGIKSGAKEAAAEASGLSKVIKGIGGGIAGGWNALGAFGKIGLVIAALTAAYKLADHFIVTGEEAKAMMKESVSDYNNAANEVKELNDQLSENQRQIAAINSKGSLSFVEQGELEKLRQSTQYLKIQADLKQKEADRKAAEAGKAVESSYKKNNLSLVSEGKINEFKKAYQENNGIDIDNFASGDISKGIYLAKRLSEGTKDINGQVLALRAYKNILNDLQNTSDADPLDIENVKAQIDDIGGFLDQKILDYIDVIQAIESIPERLRTSNQNQILSDAKESLDFLYKETDPYKWNQMKLDDLFSRNDLADARAELVKMASSMKSVGITADDIKTKFPALANAARQAGIDIEDVVNDINSAAGVYDRDEALQYLKASYKYADSIRNPQEAASALAKYSDWVENLSEDDLSIVYSIAIREDTSGWSLDEWKENLEVTKAAIADNIDTIRSDVQKAIDTQNNLTAALAAGNSATGMTAEQVKNVVDAFKDVEGFNIAELFENTATGVQMSANAFKELNKNLQLKEQAKLLDAITKKMEEYAKATDDSKKSAIAKDLIMLQAMLDEYNAATSKYNAYVTATSSANARDSYANVAAGYASVGQLIKDGWVTDDSVISYMELVLGDNWNADGALTAAEAYAKLGETIDGTSSSLKDYLATDSKGNLTSKGVWQFAEDVFSKFKDDSRGIASMADDGTLKLDLTGERLQAVAEAFGTTTDMVMLFGQALSNAGMNVEFGSLADQIGNIDKQIEQTKKEIEAAQEAGDTDAISAWNQKLDSQLKDKIDAVVANSKGSLSDMLDMDDVDLAGALGLDPLDLGENLGTYLDYARQQLQSLGQSTGEIPLNVKIDEGQFNSMLAALVGEPVEIPVEPTADGMNTDGLGDKDVEIPVNVVPTMNNVDLASTAGDGANATATIDYEAGSMPTEANPIEGTATYNGVFPTSAPTISGTAVYTVVYQGGAGGAGGAGGGGGGGRASGTMTSVAHADGTAYNVLNYTRLTPSHAGGQVALPSDEYALTNEVG